VKPPRDALLLLGMSAAARLAVALGTDITYDEAYYWTWSRSLEWSYFDHPPLVAWLIRLLGVRGAALGCGAVALALVYGFAADLHGRPEAGWRAAALWSVLPASVLPGVFATPDSPLMPFWVASLWALHRRRWVLAGALAGGAMLSKYPGALLLFPALAAAIAWRERPWKPLLGAGAALAVVSPVIAWNAAHDWQSFAFQLGHGLGRDLSPGGGLQGVAAFLGGQLAMAGLVFPLGLAWLSKGGTAVLKASLWAPLLVFGAASYWAPGQANWAAFAYLAPCVWAGGAWRWPERGAAMLGAAVCLAGMLHLTYPVVTVERDSSLARTHGWRELRELGRERVAVIYAPNFGLASELAYYSGVEVAIAGYSRLTQFDFWPEPRVPPGADALFVTEWEGHLPPERLAAGFESVDPPRVLETGYRGRTLHRFQLWTLRKAKGPPDRERPSVTERSPQD
jgi:hypothetical protein